MGRLRGAEHREERAQKSSALRRVRGGGPWADTGEVDRPQVRPSRALELHTGAPDLPTTLGGEDSYPPAQMRKLRHKEAKKLVQGQ